MLRLLTGIFKGLVAGAAIGAAAWALGIRSGVLLYVVYGAVGALVGVICGKAPWKHETLWTPFVKALFGFVIGAGLYYGWNRLAGNFELPMASQLGAPAAPKATIPNLLGPLIGLVYRAVVEMDDSTGDKKRKADAPAEKKAPTEKKA